METKTNTDIKDSKTLIRLIRACKNVYAYTKLSRDIGDYIKLQKTDLLQVLKEVENNIKEIPDEDEWGYIYTYNSDLNTIYIR